MIRKQIREQLEPWAVGHGLEVSEAAWARLDVLVDLWLRYGRAINLTGARTHDALVEHVREALQCIACAQRVHPLQSSTRWLDVGSGGGLPGLVVAAVCPCEIILVEPRQRRAAFLEMAMAALHRPVQGVIRARRKGSTWRKEGSGRNLSALETLFDIVSSRAVFSPEQWVRIGRDLVQSRGVILVHVNKNDDHVIKSDDHVKDSVLHVRGLDDHVDSKKRRAKMPGFGVGHGGSEKNKEAFSGRIAQIAADVDGPRWRVVALRRDAID